eukprot:2901355-Rhodomonas_salina.2
MRGGSSPHMRGGSSPSPAAARSPAPPPIPARPQAPPGAPGGGGWFGGGRKEEAARQQPAQPEMQISAPFNFQHKTHVAVDPSSGTGALLLLSPTSLFRASVCSARSLSCEVSSTGIGQRAVRCACLLYTSPSPRDRG